MIAHFSLKEMRYFFIHTFNIVYILSAKSFTLAFSSQSVLAFAIILFMNVFCFCSTFI